MLASYCIRGCLGGLYLLSSVLLLPFFGVYGIDWLFSITSYSDWRQLLYVLGSSSYFIYLVSGSLLEGFFYGFGVVVRYWVVMSVLISNDLFLVGKHRLPDII